VAPCGLVIAYHGMVHLQGDDGAEFFAVFTHGRLEFLDPVIEDTGDAYRCVGRGLLWTRESW
jgi:hypothetical protein